MHDKAAQTVDVVSVRPDRERPIVTGLLSGGAAQIKRAQGKTRAARNGSKYRVGRRAVAAAGFCGHHVRRMLTVLLAVFGRRATPMAALHDRCRDADAGPHRKVRARVTACLRRAKPRAREGTLATRHRAEQQGTRTGDLAGAFFSRLFQGA